MPLWITKWQGESRNIPIYSGVQCFRIYFLHLTKRKLYLQFNHILLEDF